MTIEIKSRTTTPSTSLSLLLRTFPQEYGTFHHPLSIVMIAWNNRRNQERRKPLRFLLDFRTHDRPTSKERRLLSSLFVSSICLLNDGALRTMLSCGEAVTRPCSWLIVNRNHF